MNYTMPASDFSRATSIERAEQYITLACAMAGDAPPKTDTDAMTDALDAFALNMITDLLTLAARHGFDPDRLTEQALDNFPTKIN